MQFNEDDYLMLSGIQHYAFCPRQWALIHMENIWSDNWRTTSGTIMHERTHSKNIKEKRDTVITLRSLKVVSHSLGISGECDVVEFIRNESGIELNNYSGKYLPFPIEYKRGKEKTIDADELQLCAQAICLEEMLLCDIKNGALFYGETHRRTDVAFTQELREKVKQSVADMHKMMRSGKTPAPNRKKNCLQCSLNGECVPTLQGKKSVKKYMKEHMAED